MDVGLMPPCPDAVTRLFRGGSPTGVQPTVIALCCRAHGVRPFVESVRSLLQQHARDSDFGGWETPPAQLLWERRRRSLPKEQWPSESKTQSWAAIWSGAWVKECFHCPEAVAFTDGSCIEIEVHNARLSVMGAGVAYRQGGNNASGIQEPCEDKRDRFLSFVPEEVALLILVCLHKDTPRQAHLAVEMDNASFMHDIQICSFTTFWKDLERNHHKELLTKMIALLRLRTAHTLVRVKSAQRTPSR